MKSIRYQACEILPFHPIEYGGFQFTAFPVLHETSPTKPVGYVIEKPENGKKLVITGDTGLNIPNKSLELITNPKKPDILIVDCFIDNQEDTIKRFKNFVFDFDFFRNSNHLIFPDILEFIERVKPKKKTYLIHLSHLCAPHDQLESNLKKYDHIKAAYDGLTINL